MLAKLGRLLGRVVIRHPWKIAAMMTLIFAVFSAGVVRARFSTDYRIFFTKSDPGLAAFEKLESVFTKTDNVLFVVKAENGTIFAPDALEAIQDLTEEGWKLPHASRVDSVANFQHATSSADDISVGPLVRKPARDLSAQELADIRSTANAEPLLRGSLLARDERTTGINVTLRLPGKDQREVTDAADAARSLARAVAARHPGLDIRVSGMAMVNDAFMQASIRDMATMIPLMIVVVLAAMAFMTWSIRGTAAVAVVLGMTATMSMAFAGWAGYPLTPPAVAAPMIVLTVAVANGVHLVLAVLDAVRQGKSKDEAIVYALEHNLESITYAWLTTVVGFVCLNYSDAPPVTHLANMTCLGVTAAFVWSFTLLPAILAIFPLRVAQSMRDRAAVSSERYRRFTDFIIRRRRIVLVLTGALTVVAGWGASRLETNDQFVQYFAESLPFRRDVDFTMKNLSGIYRLEYQVGSGEPSGITNPAYLTSLDRFSDWLRQQPEVEHVYSLTDIVKRVNQVVNDDAPAHYRIPETREATGQALFLYEMGLPPGLEMTDRISVDKSATRLSVTVKDMSTREMNAFGRRSEAWMHANLPSAMWSEATGPVVIFSQLGDKNAKSMVKADFVSLALISLCMIVVLRSGKLGLLSLVPNIIPIILGYGIWKLFVGQMNIVASVAASISLGIIVDDTIHFLTKYQATRAKGITDPAEAMRQTLATVGPAMTSTSVILVVGFGVLTFSSFQMTSYLGWLSLVIVGVAPITDLIVAPALVVALSRDVPVSEPTPSIESRTVQAGAR
jgi:predicted RND superfamily exporter protein